jgi:hypothetical protein
MSEMFLSDEEIAQLTGRKFKSHQILTLRQMRIPFFVNATGHPVVTRAAVEGGTREEKTVKTPWVSKVLRAH